MALSEEMHRTRIAKFIFHLRVELPFVHYIIPDIKFQTSYCHKDDGWGEWKEKETYAFLRQHYLFIANANRKMQSHIFQFFLLPSLLTLPTRISYMYIFFP